ncbi:hypothetical protein P9112_005933 [Eukaryota sp. TZLM1-RC]
MWPILPNAAKSIILPIKLPQTNTTQISGHSRHFSYSFILTLRGYLFGWVWYSNNQISLIDIPYYIERVFPFGFEYIFALLKMVWLLV